MTYWHWLRQISGLVSLTLLPLFHTLQPLAKTLRKKLIILAQILVPCLIINFGCFFFYFSFVYFHFPPCDHFSQKNLYVLCIYLDTYIVLYHFPINKSSFLIKKKFCVCMYLIGTIDIYVRSMYSVESLITRTNLLSWVRFVVTKERINKEINRWNTYCS